MAQKTQVNNQPDVNPSNTAQNATVDDMRYALLMNATQPQSEPQTVLAGRGVPVQPFDTSIVPGAIQGLGQMLYGAGKGAVSGVFGAPGDINSLLQEYVQPNLPQGVQSALQALPSPNTSAQIAQKMPTTGSQTENAATWLGQNVLAPMVGPEAIAATRDLPIGLAIKNKGGNWIGEDINDLDQFKKPVNTYTETPQVLEQTGLTEKQLADLPFEKRRELFQPYLTPENKSQQAVNDWIDKKLKSYVRNEMGTPTDPVRELHDKGITHLNEPGNFDDYINRSMESMQKKRAKADLPEKGFATTPLGKTWEHLADTAIKTEPASMRIKESVAWNRRDTPRVNLKTNPWLKTIEPETPVHTLLGGMHSLGFGHLVDELKNSISPSSDLPAHLKLKPEALDRVTVPQAVERVHRINEWRADQMANAAKENLKDFPVVHEGETGNIHELKMPEGENGREKLDKALKNEGGQMGHCVGGYTDSVANGSSRIFSLRDPKGGAHVTIEARPGQITGDLNIEQIKGKGNQEVHPKYHSDVQDFLNSKADEIGTTRDLHNVGLTDLKSGVVNQENLHPLIKQKYRSGELPRFVSDEQVQATLNPPAPEGHKNGGRIIKLNEGGKPLTEYEQFKIDNAERIKQGQQDIANRNKYDPYKGSDKPVETPKGNKGLSGGAGFTPGTMNPFNPDSPLNHKTGGKISIDEMRYALTRNKK
jgi:hypothetical protein